jgi:hypothetical protein
MFDIGKYLEKFKTLSFSRNYFKNIVVEAVKEFCKIEIDTKNINIKEGVVRVNERPIVKNEIFLKKEKILRLIKEKSQGKIWDIL